MQGLQRYGDAKLSGTVWLAKEWDNHKLALGFYSKLTLVTRLYGSQLSFLAHEAEEVRHTHVTKQRQAAKQLYPLHM